MVLLELYTWREYYRDKELRDVDWAKLTKYVDYLRRFQQKFPPEDQIEEPAPTIDENSFRPGGWVGIYKVGEDFIKIMPDPDKIPANEFEQIRKELTGWLEYIGPFMEDLFRFYMNEVIFKRLMYTTYSRRLVEYTEVLLSHFIPRDVLTREYVGQELRGTPSWKKTLVLRTKGSRLFASREVEFSFRTLPNLLLTRFHAELLRDMKAFLNRLGEEDLPEFLKMWKIYRMYHEEFISSGIWVGLLEDSLLEDFESLDVLEKVRRMAKGEIVEIVDLWEAYATNKSFFADFRRRFDTALKPLSKIYELWCFKKLCDILGIDRRLIRKFPCRLSFKFLDTRTRLYYNTVEGLRKYSGIMKRVPVPLGRPDFVLEGKQRITCIMDAKCKTELDIGDVQRFLSYIFDYMYPTQERFVSLIFNISKEEEIRRIEVKGCEIYLISMTPTSYPNVKDQIKSVIESTLT